ncbi:MAG: ABC-2 transporter permease [Spirochaetaceae bacterium]|jgi:ABC-2 type transport system permease protein|nr:ABC-2 transporter permease [Spirochaetaceae bacterium]
MLNLLYKELNLSIHKFFIFIFPVITGLLFLIPQWPYLIALMYFIFVSITNIFGGYNAQKDYEFSIMMPVRKSDIVKAKIAAMIILEIIHIFTGVVFALLHNSLFGSENFFLDLNPAFFGLGFIMFALFNISFFPMYFKTAYRYGLPTIIGVIVTVLFFTALELLVMFNRSASTLVEGSGMASQSALLFAGVAVYALLNLISVKISVRNFEQVDL